MYFVEDRRDGARVGQVSGRVGAQERQRAALASVRGQRHRAGRVLPALALPVLPQAPVAVAVVRSPAATPARLERLLYSSVLAGCALNRTRSVTMTFTIAPYSSSRALSISLVALPIL